MKRCNACGARLEFVVTPENRRMPVEIYTEQVRVFLVDGKAHVGKTWVAHWKNCSAPADFRKKPKEDSRGNP